MKQISTQVLYSILIRVFLNTFRSLVYFPIFPEAGLGLQGFDLRGVALQGFRAQSARKRRRGRRFRKF